MKKTAKRLGNTGGSRRLPDNQKWNCAPHQPSVRVACNCTQECMQSSMSPTEQPSKAQGAVALPSFIKKHTTHLRSFLPSARHFRGNVRNRIKAAPTSTTMASPWSSFHFYNDVHILKLDLYIRNHISVFGTYSSCYCIYPPINFIFSEPSWTHSKPEQKLPTFLVYPDQTCTLRISHQHGSLVTAIETTLTPLYHPSNSDCSLGDLPKPRTGVHPKTR